MEALERKTQPQHAPPRQRKNKADERSLRTSPIPAAEVLYRLRFPSTWLENPQLGGHFVEDLKSRVALEVATPRTKQAHPVQQLAIGDQGRQI